MTIETCMRTVRHLFGLKPIVSHTPIWVTAETISVLIDMQTGRVLAHIWDDECGKYYPTIYVAPWRVPHLMQTLPVCSFSIRPFPRIALELLRLKVDSHDVAQRIVCSALLD